MRTKLRSKATLLFILVAALIAVPVVAAIADQLRDELVANNANQNIATINANDANGYVNTYHLDATGAGANVNGQCDVDNTHPVTFSIDTPTGVTATPSTLTFKQCGDATTNTQDVKFTSDTPNATGYTITATQTSSTPSPAIATGNATFTLKVTKATEVSAVSGTGTAGGNNGSLTATLASKFNANENMSGKTILFQVDKQKNGTFVNVCGASPLPACPQTNGSGVATLNNVSLAGLAADSYPMKATFAGDSGTDPVYSGSTGTGNLTVNPACTAPSITQQPSDQSIIYGADANFSVAVNGTSPSVQWQKNTGGTTWDNVSTGTSLTVTKPPVSDSGNKYRAVVSNSCGSVTSNEVTLTVAQKALTATFTAANKTYNGTTAATITGSSITGGKVGTDDVNISHANASASFADKDFGTGKTVTGTGFTLTGTTAGNYKLPSSLTTTADIDKRTVTASITANDKDYDGNDNATISSCTLDSQNGNTGALSGETNVVGCSASNAHFNSASAGTDKTVTATVGLTGTGAGNYQLSSTSATDTSVEIRKVLLTVTADNQSKTYDGNPFTAFTRTITGFVNNEDDSVVSGTVTYNGSAVGAVNAGPYTITPVVSGLSATNYTFTPANGALTINKRPITVTADAQSKLFNDPDPAPLTYKVTSQLSPALVGTDTFTGALTRVTGEAVGQYDILQGNVSAGPNYAITYVGAKLTIGAWTFKGFYQPVDMDVITTTGTTTALNTVKNGSTVPMKFNVLKGATALTDNTNNAVVKSFTQQSVLCPSGAGVVADEIEVTTTGGTSLRYDSTAGQWIQNWQTPKKPNTCYNVTLTTQDGSKLVAHFQLK
jgi:MBG domain (YGX type)/YDG domain/Immunoglobulin I-set domain